MRPVVPAGTESSRVFAVLVHEPFEVINVLEQVLQATEVPVLDFIKLLERTLHTSCEFALLLGPLALLALRPR